MKSATAAGWAAAMLLFLGGCGNMHDPALRSGPLPEPWMRDLPPPDIIELPLETEPPQYDWYQAGSGSTEAGRKTADLPRLPVEETAGIVVCDRDGEPACILDIRTGADGERYVVQRELCGRGSGNRTRWISIRGSRGGVLWATGCAGQVSMGAGGCLYVDVDSYGGGPRIVTGGLHGRE